MPMSQQELEQLGAKIWHDYDGYYDDTEWRCQFEGDPVRLAAATLEQLLTGATLYHWGRVDAALIADGIADVEAGRTMTVDEMWQLLDSKNDAEDK